MSRRSVLATVAVLVALATTPAAAQQFICDRADEASLRRSVAEHFRETVLMDQKWKHTIYGGGKIPEVEPATLDQVIDYLRRAAPRRAAVLYQARGGESLCTWLVTPDGIEAHRVTVAPGEYETLRARLFEALQVPSKARGRAPVRRGVSDSTPAPATGDRDALLAAVSRIMFPPAITARLVGEKIETLVVLPTADLGTIPFAALPFRDRPLVESMSVLVAPGFEAFRGGPRLWHASLSPAIVVGDPVFPWDPVYELPPLPGARAEAQLVATGLSTEPLLGAAATIAGVKARIASRAGPPDLVYLATHGVSDSKDPLDNSVLWLSDGRWSARAIHGLNLKGSRPLVVLSACQTGLGKNFDVGTIGMARAWTTAGAASVVMSLWRVDDQATRELMTRFIRYAREEPADRALRHAMLELRAQDPDPLHWASFTVYGVPERIPVCPGREELP